MPQAIALPNWHQNEPGTKKAFLLSLLVHALLVIMLTVHINWKTSSSPAGVEVELWDNTPPPPPPPEPVIIEKTFLPVQEKADIVYFLYRHSINCVRDRRNIQINVVIIATNISQQFI